MINNKNPEMEALLKRRHDELLIVVENLTLENTRFRLALEGLRDDDSLQLDWTVDANTPTSIRKAVFALEVSKHFK